MMKIGIPKGLLYQDYRLFVETFFGEMGAEIVPSPETNRRILDLGVQYCVDEACLPIKVFHGHVSWLRDRCDAIFIPRIMSVREKEFICPKFCGLTEMVQNSIPSLPRLIGGPIYWTSDKAMYEWAKEAGGLLTNDRRAVNRAFALSIDRHHSAEKGIRQTGYRIHVALLGHPYNVQDTFVNMDLVRKLNQLGVGVITPETVEECYIRAEVDKLFKKPFWTFAVNTYGAAVHLYQEGQIDGMIYVSSFACGIDSVVIELIQDAIDDFPFLILKLDEHTGEAGFDTRIEAFVDLFGRRRAYVGDHSALGQRLPGCEGIV